MCVRRDGGMPRTKQKVARKNVRLPKPLVDEVDRIVLRSGLYVNRQQFIESAVREKIERNRLAEMSDDFLVGVKETFLAHVIVNAAKGKSMPDNHLDLKQFEHFIRRFVMEMAERRGKVITKDCLDEITEDLLEYHRQITEGLSFIANH